MKKTNLKLKRFKFVSTKVVSVGKMFTIHKRLVNSLKTPLRQIIYLSFGRLRDLSSRARQVSDFLVFLAKMKDNHGADFTVKWLKASYVALQKALASDNLKSLRDLEPDLPLPRVINGIPAYIKSRDRYQIRIGNKKVIIFWSSLFSIYRVLRCTYKLKIGTITDPFKGNQEEFDKILLFNLRNPFGFLKGYPKLREINLAPRKFLLLRSSSSTNNVSWHGLITDAVMLYSDNKMFEIYQSYLAALDHSGWSSSWIQEKVKELAELGVSLNEHSALRAKCSFREKSAFGQFALKEEAAGKLRIFAIVDSITQTLLDPIHKWMFSLLKLIPNDGTFDQEASIKRSQLKAVASGQAFSYDLSAATDRLPVALTEKILAQMWTPELAVCWRRLIAERPFAFTQKTVDLYDAPTEQIYYSVGQPMGALSSWPALAITHHWILQYASYLLGRSGWETQYEILGDDLVVFDKELGNKYLYLCTILGVEINLSKSISSPERPVFEFAKRTCWGHENLSPIPFNQLLSNRTLGERLNNILAFLSRGLLVKPALIGTVLSKFGAFKSWKASESNSLLAILGVLHSKGIIPHRWLVESIIEPSDEFSFEDSELSLPKQSIVNLIVRLNQGDPEVPYPFSNEELRKEFYDDYEPEFANVIANTALTKLKLLQNDLQNLIEREAINLIAPKSLPSLDSLLRSQIIGFFDDLLYEDGKWDVDEMIDSFESDHAFYYRQLDLEKALSLERAVERYLFHFTLTPKKFGETKSEVAPLFRILDKVVSCRPSAYFRITKADWS